MDDRLTYGIAAAARLTGVAPETLRMWERRYPGLQPSRTAGGSRRYDDDDIAHLRLVARALAAGHRPGEVVGLSNRALARLTGEQRADVAPASALDPYPSVEACLGSVKAQDPDSLRGQLRRAATMLGLRRFIDEVAHPLAVQVGELWECGELGVRHEHLATECLATQLRALMLSLEGAAAGPAVVLATFPGELHALGLDMVALRLAARGALARLLGPSCPPREIADAARSLSAEVVGISVSTSAPRRATARHLGDLLDALDESGTQVWVGGAGATYVRATDRRVRVVQTSAELDVAMSELQRRAPAA